MYLFNVLSFVFKEIKKKNIFDIFHPIREREEKKKRKKIRGEERERKENRE